MLIGGPTRKAKKRRAYAPTVAAYPTPKKKAAPPPKRAAYTPTRAAYPTPKPRAPVAGPPTPSKGKLAQIRKRNERAKAQRDARATERTYTSLAKAVKKRAREQPVERRALAQERYYSSYKSPKPKPSKTHPHVRSGIQIPAVEGKSIGATKGGQIAKRFTVAPALKALEELQRTSYAAGGAARAFEKEDTTVGSVLTGAKKGLLKQGKVETPSEVVLEDWKPKSGLGKFAKGAASLAIDIPTDVTTYASGGLVGIGRKAALKASEEAAESAARAKLKSLTTSGVSRKQAKKTAKAHGDEVGRRVYRREAAKRDVANERRGVSVSFAGRRTRKARRKLARALLPKSARTQVRKRGPAAPLTRATVYLGKNKKGVKNIGRIPGTKTTGRDVSKGSRKIASSLHGGVRPVRAGKEGDVAISHETNIAEKAVRREGRAESERLIRESQARHNALWGRLSDEEGLQVRDAIESGRLGKLRDKAERKRIVQMRGDPAEREKLLDALDAKEKRLIDTAVDLRAEDRYIQRLESRAGPLAGRVGKESRAPAEVEQGARAHVSPKRQARTRAIHERETQRQVAELETRFTAKADQRSARLRQLHAESDRLDRYYEQVRASGTPAERRAIVKAKADAQSEIRALKANAKADREAIKRTREARDAELNELKLEQAGQTARAEGAAKSAKVLKRERLREQAKGYFARATDEELDVLEQGGLFQRLASDIKPSREKVGRAKPQIGAQKQREHREAVADLAEGTAEQQAHAARLSENIRGVRALRGITGARSVGQAQVNRRIADEFGEKLPAHKDVSYDSLGALKEQGKSVYYVQRGNLERLDPVNDYAEIKRASMRPEQRAASDRTMIRLLRDEGRSEEQVQAEWAKRAKGGRYVVLDDSQVARVQGEEMGLGSKAGLEAWDSANRVFKGVALMTPQYLTRNFTGDMFNAWTEENVFRLMRNVVAGQRPLQALGQRERALRIGKTDKSRKKLDQIEHTFTAFNRTIGRDPRLRTIKLTPEIAREIAGPSSQRLFQVMRKDLAEKAKRENPDWTPQQVKAHVRSQRDELQAQMEANLRDGKTSAVAFAQLAERYGVVRQGRFQELMTEGRSPLKGKAGGTPWALITKRVEDSNRIGTFMSGLQRGMTPREAADRAIQIHFDYGDLTPIEKGVLRRMAPFYTFPSRNVPLQARQFARRPGKYSTIEKIRQQAASAAGLQDGWEENLSPFEARQIPIPFKFGDRTVTASIGSPFTDLNDVVGFARGAANITQSVSDPEALDAAQALNVPLIPVKRAMEMLGPIKVFAEAPLNKSFYFREDIAPEGRTLTRAPGWAIALSKLPGGTGDAWKKFARIKQKGDGPVMWDKRSDHVARAFQPGIIGMGSELAGHMGIPVGVQGEGARGRTPGQRLAGYLTGVRTVTYDPKQAAINRNYDRRGRLEARNQEQRQLTRESTGRDWEDRDQTPAYKTRLKRIRTIEDRIEQLEGTKKKKRVNPWAAEAPSAFGGGGGVTDGSAWK